MAKKNTATDSIRHKDKRANIPTHELADFVAEEEKAPKEALYPRDSSLDPQLVWKGKDEQDREDLVVPTVPIYIQEKIHPQAIIEGLRAQAMPVDPQYELFGDFNGIEFEDLVDFYRHEQNWANRLILGDSLLVMNSLAEKEGLKGKVQMVYMDPPYGIRFGSNWQVSTRKRDVKDGKADSVTRQPEQIKAFRDTWELGIHSYLTYLRDRLVVARELLSETGSIFIQISDENVHLVRALMDEVFGSDNFVRLIAYRTNSPLGAGMVPSTCDYLIWFAKSKEQVKFRRLFKLQSVTEDSHLNHCLIDDAFYRSLTAVEKADPSLLPENAKVFRFQTMSSSGYTPSCTFPYPYNGKEYSLAAGKSWRTNLVGMDRLAKAGRLIPTNTYLNFCQQYNDFPYIELNNLWVDTHAEQNRQFVVQTSTKVIERCLLMVTDPGDLVLDPTCGSGTTAFIAEQRGRRWITIDTSRVALALARTRMMAAKYPYYLLADSTDGVKKETEITGRVPDQTQRTEQDIRKGFVYKRLPHITLKAIAHSEEIDEIYARFEDKLGALHRQLKQLTKQNWQEWEVPRQADSNWSKEAVGALESWWSTRRKRQQEIDDAIARNSEPEPLYDVPFEDTKRVRVTGPFTVESLSPHRVLAADEEQPESERTAKDTAVTSWDFTEMILDNLRKAGVQNTRKEERLKFETLEPFSGVYIQARGEYTDVLGNLRKVAISLGPEHGTVGREHVKDAAKEALRGTGFDLLLVCAFAFDGTASEGAREFIPETQGDGFAVAEETKFGKLPILLVRMNPDLAMGDELLKKTGSGNLFMVFGEPDVQITNQNGLVQVELRGLDIYDPTTGVVRNSKGTDDIACWFIDTNYNQESFFVRHAYFTGGNEPYEKLKRALKADIDESAWTTLNSNKSRPFPTPRTGKIAIKVINDYGDEVLKVYTC